MFYLDKIPVPKYMRSCNVVAWNPVDTHLIMSGLDKHSKEHSVLLWDVHHCPKGSERPIIEAGISETVHSAAWFKHESRCLALGVNNKQLKVIDFRGMLLKDMIYDLPMYESIIDTLVIFF